MEPTLRRIDLNRRKNCEHPDITEEGFYLVKIYGIWHGGAFTRQRFGLCFEPWGESGIPLNSPMVQRIYAVENLT